MFVSAYPRLVHLLVPEISPRAAPSPLPLLRSVCRGAAPARIRLPLLLHVLLSVRLPKISPCAAVALSAPAQPLLSSRKRDSTKDSVGLYAVQCCECYKWRMVPTKEDFETIRENFTEEPWFCRRRPDCSCEEPADIEYDNSRIWVIDKPNIPKPPPETERLVIMRRDYSKMDTYYVMPNGKRARCSGDVDKFLEAHPEYKDRISVSSFSFAPPKVVEETVSHNTAWKAAKAKKQDKADALRGQK